MRVELPIQPVEGRDDGRTTLDTVVGLSEEMPDVLPSLIRRGARSQSDSVGPREKFLLTFDRPIDHLTPDGLNWQFNAHGVELGQRYISGALVSDGTPFPAYTRDPELYYHPTTHPGAHLPHVWLQRGAERVSTLDLADYSRFTLLTGVGGRAWIDAASVVEREFGLQIAAHSVGMRQSNDDVSGDWARRREIDDRGCILVRPDRFVAWRSHDLLADPAQALRDVLMEILDRAPARAETRINIGA